MKKEQDALLAWWKSLDYLYKFMPKENTYCGCEYRIPIMYCTDTGEPIVLIKNKTGKIKFGVFHPEYLTLLVLLLLLSGCKIENANRENSIHPEILNKEKAVVIQPDSVGHVETNLSAQPNAIHVEPINVPISVPISGIINKDAFHVEPISISGKIDTGAVQIPISFVVPEGAIKINFSISEGAISIRGAEAGAVNTQIEVPVWSYIIMGILGAGWLVTKMRRHPEIKSVRDILF